MAGVSGLLRHPERLRDALPGPSGGDRLVDVGGLPRLEPPPQLGDRGQALRGGAEARGGLQELRLVLPCLGHPAANGTSGGGRRQCALTIT
jgi:hypothetical protein